MKKIVMMVVVLAMSMATMAQGQNEQVTKIRKKYAEAKEIIASKQKAEIPLDETEVTSNYMAPGAGPIKDVTHYFYDADFDENLGSYFYTPYFITRKFNVGATDYYEEFLFDKDNLVFYFCKYEGNEIRYYWGENGFFHEAIKGQREMDEVFALRLANDLKEAFNRLMNREY